MGVRGLQTYCTTHCSGVCEHVNIEHLAHEYHRNTGKVPTIVVDGPSCLRRIYADNNWVCGGQFKQFVENCYAFVNRFHIAGIRLVFFFDGPTVIEKRETWVERRKRSIVDVEKIFDSLEQNNFSEERFNMQQPVGLNNYARYIFKHTCHCEVYASVRECDAEIADYSRKHSCFAVMAQDTDFIIYNSAPYYFSANDLDIEKLETINYNSKALAANLRLSVLHLPLFASLMGNDCIPFDKLKNFHTRYCRKRTGNKFEDIALGIADYVRNFPPVGHGLHGFLQRICQAVFNDISMCDTLDQSILSYLPHEDIDEKSVKINSNSVWQSIVELVAHKHKNIEIPSPIYAVVNQMPYEASSYMEDFRRLDIPSSGIISRKCRQRLYSVLLSECPHAEFIEEWCVTGKNSLERPHIVQIIKPLRGMLEPYGLQVLLDERNKDEEVVMKRWSLMAWIISPNLPVTRVRSLPSYLVIPTTALYYLTHEVQPQFLTHKEVEVLIVVSLILQHYDTSRLSQIVIRRPVARAIRITTVYLRLAVQVFYVNGGFGFPIPPQDCLPSNYFDGKLFQDLYSQMTRHHSPQNQLRSEYQIELFQNIRNLVLN